MTSTTAPERTNTEHFRMMSVAARLYHVQDLRQRDIAERLSVSQASVSRLLRQAQDHGIVQTVLLVPEGLHPALEEQIEDGYGVSEVHVVEVPGGDEAVPHTLGRSAAQFFPAGTFAGAVTGFASQSLTLQEMALALDDSLPRSNTSYVVEMLGALGPPQRQRSAARATQRLADVLGAKAVFLRTPGLFKTAHLRNPAAAECGVRPWLGLLDRLDVAFVSVGPPDLRSWAECGNEYLSQRQLFELRDRGVVGQLNQRFVDAEGRPVVTPLDDLVVGATLAQLSTARRRVVVAGGAAKHKAIAAALRGGWVDSLMTDLATARHLVQQVTRNPLPMARATH